MLTVTQRNAQETSRCLVIAVARKAGTSKFDGRDGSVEEVYAVVVRCRDRPCGNRWNACDLDLLLL